MYDPDDPIVLTKSHVAAILYLPLIFLVSIAVYAFIRVPMFLRRFSDFGMLGRFPVSTVFLAATYRFWGVLPLGLGGLTAYWVRSAKKSTRDAVIIFVCSSCAFVLLCALLFDGIFAWLTAPMGTRVVIYGNTPAG